MSLKCVSAKINDTHKSCIITLEADNDEFSDQIEELNSAAARHLAIAEACKAGMSGDPGISRTNASAYPVNAKGTCLADVAKEEGEELPDSHYLMQPQAYRAEYTVTTF